MKRRRSHKLRIALAQTDCELGNLEANIQKATRIINEYRNQADLIVFPELSLTGYGVGESFHEYALNTDDEVFQELIWATHGTTVAVGLIEETSWFAFYNSLAFLSHGKLLGVHRKIFLPNYGKFEERKYFSPGPNYRCIDLKPFRIAPLICGDAWDPALPNIAAADHANLFVVAVNSPEAGLGSRFSSKDSWKRANRFYASMYGSYVVFVNRVGTEREMRFWGQSEIIDPYGNQVLEASDSTEEVVIAEIDLADIREARTTLHTVRDQDLGFVEKRLREIRRSRSKIV